MNPANVVILAQSQDRMDLLRRALERAAPQSLKFSMIDSTLNDVDTTCLQNARLLAIATSVAETASLIVGAKKLRSDKLYWEPIHICTSSKQARPDYEDQWALYFHDSPPDVRSLAKELIESPAVTPQRRQEILRAFVISLADDLSLLADRFEFSREVEPERLRTTMRRVLSELSHSKGTKFNVLRQELSQALSRPSSNSEEFNRLRLLVTKTENILRVGHEQSPLLTQLHTLNNILRLVEVTPEAPTAPLLRTLGRIKLLDERAISDLPAEMGRATESLKVKVEPVLQSIANGTLPQQSGSQISEIVGELFVTTLADNTFRQRPIVEGGIKRVVVIEDDPDWRRRLVAIVEKVVAKASIEVQQAATLDQAQLRLKEDTPALALVDLGLPPTDGLEILPDAGLSLVKQFTGPNKQGRNYQHRFVILTAAEDYVEAVREALALGISPGSYLQKDPVIWESSLLAQLRLRLQPPPLRAPTIEVFKRTGRIARIEGVEIKLDHPQWCLLATLAEFRKGIWNEPEKIAHVLYWNYSLNPESRNAETDQLDPEERILLQLPHYASDLRLKLSETYMQARNEPLSSEIISFEPNSGYRLNTEARVLDRVEEHFRVRRRPIVLIVEDSPDWGQRIIQELSQRGFEARLARCTDEARNCLESEAPDLVSLDLELPATEDDWTRGRSDSQHAIELLAYLRERMGNIPVTILTGIAWRDRVMLELLRQGVRIDDYISKNGEQPIARLASSLARLWQETIVESRILDWDPAIPLHPISISQKGRVLSKVSGYPIRASGKGGELLQVLSATPNVFVSRSELIESLYSDAQVLDQGPEDIDNALNQHVRRLRKTITEATANTISGDEIICGDRGIYWLRGLVQ